MKKEFLTSFLTLFFMAIISTSFSHSPDPPQVIQTNYRAELGDITAPNVPALILLGQEPSLIDRITRPKKFVITAEDLFSTESLAQPAIEFCPFRLFADGKASDYEKHDFDDDFAKALESMSLSLAAADINSTGIPARTLAVGLRTTLYSEGVNPEFKKNMNEFETLRTQDAFNQGNDSPDGNSNTFKIHKAFEEKLSDLKDGDLFAVGPFIQLAGGVGIDSPGQIGSGGAQAHTWGYWLTLAYRIYGDRPSKAPTSFIEGALLAGYMGDKHDNLANSSEVGGRLTVQLVPEVALSGEGVVRGSDNKMHTNLECGLRMDKESFLDLDYFTQGFQDSSNSYSLTASLKIEKSPVILFE